MNRTAHPVEPEEVMASLDGELAPERAAYVAAHIDACEECAAIAASLRGISTRLATWQIEPAPPVLSDSVQQAARTSSSPVRASAPANSKRIRKGVFGLPQWAWGLAGSFAVLLVIVVMLSRIQPARMRQAYGEAELPQATRGAQEQEARPAPSLPQASPKLLARGSRIPMAEEAGRSSVAPRGPMMIRTASVTLETKHFDATRAAIERIVRAHGGHIGQLQTAAPANQARTLTATLRIPADRLDAALAEVKNLGRVVKESQGSDEISQQYVDLVARLSNARNTEQRLVEILRTRTGKVTEVLEVEREIAEVREQIESMDAQRKALENRVAYSMVSLELREEFEKPIGVAPPSTGTMLWNAMVDGLDGAFESVLALAMFLLRAGPSLLLWGALLFLPARSVYRKLRETAAAQ